MLSGDKELLEKTPKWLDEFLESLTKQEVYSLKTGEIIKKTGKSREHLCRLFKSATGITLHTYLNDLRIEHSAAMLTTTYRSILDISLESGFENLSTFYNLFKKKKGLSPKQYRKKYSFIY